MAFNYEYPYTNVQQNSDWILKTVRELKETIDTHLVEYIKENIDKIMLDATYVAETETLVLSIKAEV